jgi:hypothetical protein
MRTSRVSMEHPPKPIKESPHVVSDFPPLVFQRSGRGRVHAPLIIIGLLVLVMVGLGAFLLWSPESQDDSDLTAEEVRLIEEAMRSQSPPGMPSSWEGAAGGGLPPELESGSAILEIETSPSGALVLIDDEPVGVTPVSLRRLPSRHYFVTLEMPGFPAVDTLVYVEDSFPAALAINLAAPAGGPAAFSEPRPGPTDVPDPVQPAAGSDDPRARASTPSEQPSAPPLFGSLRVRVSPAGATVLLDGRTIGQAPLEREIQPGPHTLTVAHPDFETQTVSLRIEAGATETVDISLAPRMGTLAVVVRPWGSVYVNGVLHARDTDLTVEASLPPGSHQVRVVHPQLGSIERTVEVRADGRTAAVFDLD